MNKSWCNQRKAPRHRWRLRQSRHFRICNLQNLKADRSLLDMVGLGQELEELLDRRVDVLTGASLHPAIRDRILAESRPL